MSNSLLERLKGKPLLTPDASGAATIPAKPITAPSTGYAPGSKLEALAKERAQGVTLPVGLGLNTKTVTTAATNQPETSTTTTEAPKEEPKEEKKEVEKSAELPPQKPKIAKGYRTKEDAGAKAMADAARELSGAAKDIAAMANKPATTPQTDPNEGLNEDQKSTIEVLAVMEQLYPKKYGKGFADKARDVARQVTEFEASYIKENPDSDEAAVEEAVAKFEKKHGIKFSDADFRRAEVEMTISPVRKEMEAVKLQNAELKREKDRRDLEPTMHENASVASQEVAAEFGEEFTSVLKADGSVDLNKAQKLIDTHADPIVAECAVKAIQDSKTFAENVVLYFAGEETKLEGKITEFCQHLEQRFSSQGEEQSKDSDGRTFLTADQFAAKSPRDKKLLLDGQHQSHWILSPDVVSTLANDVFIDRARKEAEVERDRTVKRAERFGYKKEAAAPPPKPANEKPETVTSTPTPSSNSTKPKPNGYEMLQQRHDQGNVGGGLLSGRR